MLHRLTIRRRILVTFVLVALAGGIVQFIIAGQQLRTATLEFYQHHLETDALLVATTFADPLHHSLDEGDREDIERALDRLQHEVGHDYLLVDTRYRVVGSTADTGYTAGGRTPETPELAGARARRIGAAIRPNAAGQDTLYLAVPVIYEDEVAGYLVLSEPMAPAYAEVRQRYLELAGATLPVLALVIAASLWIARTISRPIRQLRDSALRMANGALDTRIQVEARDEIGQLADTLNYMAAQLETLMKTQRSFVSNAAHELRTPLMTLKLRAEALADATLPDADRAPYLREIRLEIDHMAELVSSLLTLARIDEGRHPPETAVTDTVSTLHDILRHWRIEAEAAGLTFSARLDDAVDELPISPNDLRLVLDNLLSNAVKYTPQGNICVTLQAQGETVRLAIEDTGVGFAPEQRARLFDRFYRSEQARGQFSGTGLGLSVARAILDQYGGRLEAHSRGIGQGATFTVWLNRR